MDPSNWQTGLSTVQKRNEYAFNNSLFCDVEFSVVGSHGDQVTVPANKFVLAISSPVFEAMFYGELAESQPTIELKDCTNEGLREMLRYVYSDQVKLTGSNVMDVLYVSEKYMMPFLTKTCQEFIAKDLSPKDAFTVLSQAKELCCAKAEELCWNVVDFETYEAVTSEAFLNISRELLKEVLERETLHTDEIDLFKAVNRWASNKIKDESCKLDGKAKREVLGNDLVRLIRFPVMSQKDFAEHVLISEILQPSEVTEIVQVYNSLTPSQTSFPGTKRTGQWTQRWTINRFTAITSIYSRRNNKKHSRYEIPQSSNNWPENHSIAFQVNKPIFLAGIRLFGGTGLQDGDIDFSIKVKHFNSFVSLFQTRVSSKVQKINDSYNVHTIVIKGPIILEPLKEYIAEALIHYESIHYNGSDGTDVIRCDDIEITLSNSTDSQEKNRTTIDSGQFPSFLLQRKIRLS